MELLFHLPGFFHSWSGPEVNLSHDLRRGADAKGQAGGRGLCPGKTALVDFLYKVDHSFKPVRGL